MNEIDANSNNDDFYVINGKGAFNDFTAYSFIKYPEKYNKKKGPKFVNFILKRNVGDMSELSAYTSNNLSGTSTANLRFINNHLEENGCLDLSGECSKMKRKVLKQFKSGLKKPIPVVNDEEAVNITIKVLLPVLMF